MAAKKRVLEFIEKAILARVESYDGKLSIRINGGQFNTFPTKKSADFPKGGTKIKKQNYYKKRYSGLIRSILNTDENNQRHKFAFSTIEPYYFDFYKFYQSTYFEDSYYLNDELFVKKELYDKLEKLITIYQGDISH